MPVVTRSMSKQIVAPAVQTETQTAQSTNTQEVVKTSFKLSVNDFVQNSKFAEEFINIIKPMLDKTDDYESNTMPRARHIINVIEICYSNLNNVFKLIKTHPKWTKFIRVVYFKMYDIKRSTMKSYPSEKMNKEMQKLRQLVIKVIRKIQSHLDENREELSMLSDVYKDMDSKRSVGK